MAKLALKKAATDVTVYLFAQDSSKTTGEGLTGLAYNTASLTAYYVRPLGSATQITLATQTVTGAHSDGGFKEIDATNMPGVYRLDLPDAVCATGVPSAVVMLKGATNLAPVLLEIQLTDFDLNDASPNVTVADMATDSITAAALKADAVTKIQNGLALEATLTAIKGAGWTDETLAALDALIDAIKAKTDLIPAAPAQAGEYTAAIAAIPTSPLLAANYTAPDNASIGAIKLKTDQLTFTTANKVDASADVVLSPEAIESMASAIGEGLTEEIWSSSVRTLTQSPAEIIATILGADITQIRGNSWVIQLTGVALESTQQFAIKYNAAHPDSAALLFVDSVNGLTVLNGVAQDGDNTSKASLVYDGAILTITVDASITAQLPVGAWQYGIQSISNNGIVSEPYGGAFNVLADVVRTTG